MKKIYALLAGVVLTISAYSQCSVAVTSVPATCNGLCNGSATAVGSGFIPANTSYSWAPSGGTAATATSLCAGTYTVTVTDGLCTATGTVTVTEPAALAAASATTPANCLNGSDGTAIAMATGGTGPYSYNWNSSPTQTTDTATGLPAGTYACIVTDANGCSTSVATTVTQPSTAVMVAATSNSTSCNGTSDGSVMATATGGTPGYWYMWMPTGDSTQSVNNLPAGTYVVTATDTNGCTVTDTVMVNQPAVLVANVTMINASCFGVCDAIGMSNPTGGTGPYFYSWTSAATTQNDSGLCAGTHGVIVTDVNGCVANQIGVATEPTAVSVSATGTDATCIGCQNGSATAVASGGTGPYTYLWTPGNQTTATASGLGLGMYMVCVTDANGCTGPCDTVSINDGTAVHSWTSEYAVSVYPNPAHDELTFSIQSLTPVDVSIVLVDISGREVYANQLGPITNVTSDINIAAEPAGVYFLEVFLDGQKSVRKIVKE